MKAASSLSRILAPGAQPSATKILTLLAAARRLRAEPHGSFGHKPLRGTNLAMLVSAPSASETSPLRFAAEDLGVRVAEVRFDESGMEDSDLIALSRLLARLYDAIDCDALPQAAVLTIEREAPVPVYAGLGLDTHPARALADLMTLCEVGLRPGPHATLGFIGDLGTLRSEAFQAFARQLGIALLIADSERLREPRPAFLVDTSKPPHWFLYSGGAPVDEVRRSENHRWILQTVLLDSLSSA